MVLNMGRAAIGAAFLMGGLVNFAVADEDPAINTSLRQLLASDGHEGNANLDTSRWERSYYTGLFVKHATAVTDERLGNAEVGLFIGENVQRYYDPGKQHGFDQKPVGMYVKFHF
jgi:hypothetical protein